MAEATAEVTPGNATNPAGVYVHPESGAQLIAHGDMAEVQADGFVRMGFEHDAKKTEQLNDKRTQERKELGLSEDATMAERAEAAEKQLTAKDKKSAKESK